MRTPARRRRISSPCAMRTASRWSISSTFPACRSARPRSERRRAAQCKAPVRARPRHRAAHLGDPAQGLWTRLCGDVRWAPLRCRCLSGMADGRDLRDVDRGLGRRRLPQEVRRCTRPGGQAQELIDGIRAQVSAIQAAEGFGIDDVIDPAQTRAQLIDVLSQAPVRRASTMSPKVRSIDPSRRRRSKSSVPRRLRTCRCGAR